MISLYESSGAANEHAEGANADVEGWKSAMRNYSAGRYSDAIAQLKPWLNAHPADGTSWAVLGLSEFALKDFDNAQIHLERGEQLGLSGGTDAVRQAKYTFGVLLIRSGAFDHASEVLSSMVGPGASAARSSICFGTRTLAYPEDA